jgi:hypothetical protein
LCFFFTNFANPKQISHMDICGIKVMGKGAKKHISLYD